MGLPTRWTMVMALAAGIAFAASSVSAAASSELVKKHLQRLTSAIGPCACTLEPNAPDAAEKPIGKAPVRDLHGDSFTATVMNDEFALRIFQEMTVQKKIPFGFPEDGCFARAHEMSHMLDKQKIFTGKVFATGSFRVDNDKAARGYVSWRFHVAPFVVVDAGKGPRIWVIDPSLFFEPTPLETWLGSLTSHPKSKLTDVYLTKRFVYHPDQKNRKLSEFASEDLIKAKRMMKRYLKTESERTKRKAPDL